MLQKLTDLIMHPSTEVTVIGDDALYKNEVIGEAITTQGVVWKLINGYWTTNLANLEFTRPRVMSAFAKLNKLKSRSNA